jgi:hypothetical protein
MLRGINQAEQIGNPGSPGYIPPSALSQGPRTGGPGIGPSNYMAPQMSPLTQQMMQRPMMPQPMSGLPAALLQMQGRFNSPMMRGPMPTYQNPALAYRPNMAPAMEALNRVQPSVYKTDLDAARARIAELEKTQQQQQDQQNTYYNYSGG